LTDRVLCSIGAGPHAELLALSGATFELYARRWGYDLDLRTELLAPDRPASWSKVLAVRELLDRYRTVFWVDADAAIVDPGADVAAELAPRAILGLVAHRYDGQEIPNCGVMVLRRSRATRRLLDAMWARTERRDHVWWENAALLDLLGYEIPDDPRRPDAPPVRLARPRRILRRVTFLDVAWNSVAAHSSPTPRIRHYPGRSQEHRLERLAADLAEAKARAAAGDPTQEPGRVTDPPVRGPFG